MKINDINHYVKELEKVFPEVDPKSIREVIKLGNREVAKRLKVMTATLLLRGKSRVDDTSNAFILFKHNQIPFNNKAKFIQRNKDKKKNAK